jgi:pseudouridine synthase
MRWFLLFWFLSGTFVATGTLGFSTPSSRSVSSSPFSVEERTVVLLLNKPANVVTSHVAVDDRPTVYDLITMENFVGDQQKDTVSETTGIQSKLNAIGRLDADTRGLILLTNDGSLQHHVTNPNAPTHQGGEPVVKTYEALIMGHHTEESLLPLWEGVDIGSIGITKPVHKLEILDHPRHKTTLVSISISEGKNRQVRRMFHALGSGVMELKRLEIGKCLNLDGVEEGQWRILSDEEVLGSLGWRPQILIKNSKGLQKPRSTNSMRRNKVNLNGKERNDASKRSRRRRS